MTPRVGMPHAAEAVGGRPAGTGRGRRVGSSGREVDVLEFRSMLSYESTPNDGTMDMDDRGTDHHDPPSGGGIGRLVRSPIVWLPVAGGVLLAAVMTFAYVGAFVNPVGHLRDVRVGVVDLDEPVDVAGQHLAVGADFVDALTATAADDERIDLVAYASEAEARRAIGRNEIVGAIVLPASLSADVAAVGTGVGAADAATVALLRNDGAGSLQPVVFDEFAEAAVDRLSDEAADHLAGTLDDLGLTVAPDAVGSLARPVVATTEDVRAIGDAGGRGLPPFYVAVMVTLTGVLAATVTHELVGMRTGEEHLEILGREVRVGAVGADRWQRWVVEALVSIPVAVASGAAVVAMAVGVLGAHAENWPAAAALAVGGTLATMWLSLVFLTAFGIVGDVFVLFLTTIFGVPSARGVYPAEAIPTFFRVLGDVLPLRYLTDGMRAAFYFDGSGAAGLTRAWVAVAVCAGISLALGAAAARASARRRAAFAP